MRKQTKLVAVLSAAALLAIGASMTSFAAQGWTEEDGTWVYVDNDGYRVTDTWKKSGNFWYYLDEDGYMATSKLIENGDNNDNIYYVDETGRMVANKWVELENENYYDGVDDDEAETVWYYFQNSGKAYKQIAGKPSWKTINGKKYSFDENGHMLWGWVNDENDRCPGDDGYQTGVYYCGDANDGARVTADWRYLYIGTENRVNDTEDDTFWFYFDVNGKKIQTTAADNEDVTDPAKWAYKTKKINGKTYAFDEQGKMISKWSESSAKKASYIDGYFSTSDDGARKKGWFNVVPSENINSSANADEDAKWFYANNDGTLVVSKLKTINGKKYAFNDQGEMLSGLWSFDTDDDNNISGLVKIDTQKKVDAIADYTNPVYYFGSGDDGALKTGSQSVEVDGDKYQFMFYKSGEHKGEGANRVQSNVLYTNGKRIKADSDFRYQPVNEKGKVSKLPGGKIPAEGVVLDDAQYLINSSGSVMKGSGFYTDTDGRQYKVTENKDITEHTEYIVTYYGYKK